MKLPIFCAFFLTGCGVDAASSSEVEKAAEGEEGEES